MGSDGIFIHIFVFAGPPPHSPSFSLCPLLLVPVFPLLKLLAMSHTFCALFSLLMAGLFIGELVISVSLAALPSLGGCLDPLSLLPEVIYSDTSP